MLATGRRISQALPGRAARRASVPRPLRLRAVAGPRARGVRLHAPPAAAPARGDRLGRLPRDRDDRRRLPLGPDRRGGRARPQARPPAGVAGGRGLPGAVGMSAGGLPILTYHAIGEAADVTTTDPAWFAETLAALVESGHRAVDLDDWVAQGRPDVDRGFAVTFDDGLRSILRVADVLARYRVPATVFLVTDRMGRDNAWPGQPAWVRREPVLAWSDLDMLARRRVPVRRARPDPRPARSLRRRDARRRAARLARRDRAAAGPSLPAAGLSLRPLEPPRAPRGRAALRRGVRHAARRRDGPPGSSRPGADRRLLPALAAGRRSADLRSMARLAPDATGAARRAPGRDGSRLMRSRHRASGGLVSRRQRRRGPG